MPMPCSESMKPNHHSNIVRLFSINTDPARDQFPNQSNLEDFFLKSNPIHKYFTLVVQHFTCFADCDLRAKCTWHSRHTSRMPADLTDLMYLDLYIPCLPSCASGGTKFCWFWPCRATRDSDEHRKSHLAKENIFMKTIGTDEWKYLIGSDNGALPLTLREDIRTYTSPILNQRTASTKSKFFRLQFFFN